MQRDRSTCTWCSIAVATAVASVAPAAATEHIPGTFDPAAMEAPSAAPPVPPGERAPTSAMPRGHTETSAEPAREAHEDSAPPNAAESESDGTMLGVAVIILSRGDGVPDASRRALEAFRAFVTAEGGGAASVDEAVIGLEGERRLCATFDDPAAREAALAEARRLAEGIELVNVEELSCRDP